MILWPFPVDWKDGYRVTFAFKTEILVSRTRREQRRALRATARRSVEFTSRMWELDFLKFKRLLAASQDQQVLLGDAVRKTSLTAAAAESASTIQVADVPAWLVAGRYLVLRGGGETIYCQVESVAGSVVTLAAPLSAAQAAGTMVYAGMTGTLPDKLPYDQPTSRIGAVKVKFEVTPGSEPLLDLSPALTFAGREVFARKPNWRDGLSIESTRDTQTVDYDFGVTEVFSQQDFTVMLRDGTWLAQTTDVADEIQSFFERMKGRRGEFVAPRWEQDLVLSAALEAGESTMRVADAAVATVFDGDTVHRSLAVALRDGTVIYRTVTEITADGDESVLTFSATWPADVAVDDVIMVTWAPVCRFASDELVFEWITSEVAQVRMNHMTLEALSAED